jgi:hypothetical protein
MLSMTPTIWGMALLAGLLMGPSQGSAKRPAVRELDLTGVTGAVPQRPFGEPLVISSGKELRKAFPEKELQARLMRETDFKKERLLYFTWSGSGGDKLEARLEADRKPPEVVFTYRPGLTRDLRPHRRLFAIPKKATWRLERRTETGREHPPQR